MRRWQAIPVAALTAITVAVTLLVISMNAGATRPARADGSFPFDIAVDCDLGTGGIQASCPSPSAGDLDVGIVLTNESGAPVQLGAFQFDLLSDNQPATTPLAGADANFDGNPDFNQAAVTGTWNCSAVPPEPDLDPLPGSTDSRLVCFVTNSTPDGPTIADGGSLLLATVHYTFTDVGTSANLRLTNVAVYDETQSSDVASCNPTLFNDGDCFAAVVGTGAATPVPTSTPTFTATATATPPTPTACPTVVATPVCPTATTGFATVTGTGTPSPTATVTPASGAAGTPAAAGSPATSGGAGAPAGNAGAGARSPIRLPDTGAGADGGFGGWRTIALAMGAALALGALSGSAWYGAAAAQARRRGGR